MTKDLRRKNYVDDRVARGRGTCWCRQAEVPSKSLPGAGTRVQRDPEARRTA